MLSGIKKFNGEVRNAVHHLLSFGNENCEEFDIPNNLYLLLDLK